MIRLPRIIVGALCVTALLYIALVGALYAFQKRIIYPGWWRGTGVVRVDQAGYRNVPLRTDDGLRGHLLYHPAQPGKPVILFFHGNGDSVSGSQAAVAPLIAAGYGAVLPEYRGYNGNPGEPSEQGLYRDARAATRWMAANGIRPDETIVMGHSLGTGVATATALELKPRALILLAAYASIARVVADRFPWIPVDWLLSERFDTAARIGRIDCPILLLHGVDDRTIPANNSRTLAALQPRATVAIFPGIGHDIAWEPVAQAYMAAWLKQHVS